MRSCRLCPTALMSALALSNCVRADVPAFAGFRGQGLGALPGAQRRGVGGGSVTMAQDWPGMSWSPSVGYDPRRPARTQGVAGAAEVAGATKYAPTSGCVPSSCVAEAEARRRWLLGEIAGKVAEIQQTGLNDYKILELNGLIIGLVEERVRVERRIIELGGPDYSQAKDRIVDVVSTEPAVATAAPPCAQASKRWTAPEGYSPSSRRIVEDAPEPAGNSVTDPSFAAERWTEGYKPNAQRTEDDASIFPLPQLHVEHTPIMAQSSEPTTAANMQAPSDTLAPAVSTPPKKWRTAMGYVPRRAASSAHDADATSIFQKGIFAPENSIFAPENFTPAPRAVKRWTAPVGYAPNVQNNNPVGMTAAHDGADATVAPTTASTSPSKACADETRLVRGPVHDESPPQVRELV